MHEHDTPHHGPVDDQPQIDGPVVDTVDDSGLWDQQKAYTLADVISADKDAGEELSFQRDVGGDVPRTERESKVIERISIYERLYDSNPDRFSNMPTSAFMDIAREGKRLEQEFEDIQEDVRVAEEVLTEISERIEKKLPTTIEQATMDIDLIHGAPSRYPELYAIHVELVKAVYADSFEKSPRQISDDFGRLLTRMRDDLTKVAEDKHTSLDAFIAEKAA